MYQVLFIAALFLIVLLALNFELLLFPSPVILGLGVGSVLFGIGAVLLGSLRKPTAASADSGKPGAEKAPRPTGCMRWIVGSLYILSGIGVILLQAIGYFH